MFRTRASVKFIYGLPVQVCHTHSVNVDGSDDVLLAAQRCGDVRRLRLSSRSLRAQLAWQWITVRYHQRLYSPSPVEASVRVDRLHSSDGRQTADRPAATAADYREGAPAGRER